MSKPNQGPRPLADILGELFTVRGYGRLRARQELEDAWRAAVGKPESCQTQLGEVRRGVLNVTVAHSTLLEELAAFRKPALLAALRSAAPSTAIHDIRFRVGVVAPEVKRPSWADSSSAEEPGELQTARHRGATPGGRSQVEKRSHPGRGSAPDPVER
jgi:hypothetical protein